TAFSDGLPYYANTNIAKPFYRDGKIRLATYGKGIWESEMYELPAYPIAQPTVDKLTTYCTTDTFYFEDYSILMHDGATWSWTFEEGTPAASSLRNPKVVFNSSGIHTATLTVTDGFGNTSTKSVDIEIAAVDRTEIAEGFEGVFPPAFWTTTGTNSGSGIWNKTAQAGGFGTSTNSAAANNYDTDLQGSYGDLRAFINLENATEAVLTFDVAYTPYSSGYTDTLAVLVTTDCGETFTQLYYAGGFDLATAPPYSGGYFIPANNQWRNDTVHLNAFIGEANAIIVFRNIGGWGQWLYIDNVNLNGLPLTLEQPEAINANFYPNPVHTGDYISLNSNSNETFTAEIFDLNGKMLLKQKMQSGAQVWIDKTFAPGTYMFRLSGETFMRYGKLVVM
ncbi:MAG: T9SS type A sorting domain-containing protein, partial [Chitinophagales bacterium]